MPRKKLKKRVKRAIGFQLVKYLASFAYLTGLTSLIPLLPLLLAPERLINAKAALLTASAFVLVGFTMVYWFSGSKRVALRALGGMTLFPGLLAVVALFSGPRRMADFMRLFGEFSPLLEEWLSAYLPTAWLLAGIYIIVGVSLVFVSYEVRR